MPHRIGKQTLAADSAVSVAAWASVGSRMEMEGPLGGALDYADPDGRFGQESWEKAESFMQKKALSLALEKAGLAPGDLDYLLAGDLLNQCIASTYALRDFPVPFLGLFGACSSSALGLGLAALLVDCGAARRAAAVTSSHFGAAERQFRFPLQYGGQRTPTAQWTATAAGAMIASHDGRPPFVRRITTGLITDLGVTDANNMGAAMAPAAAGTLQAYFADTGTRPEDYDLVVTGDLGAVGSELLEQLMQRADLPLSGRRRDCGLLLYDREKQKEVNAGGSGCGCSASVLCASLLPALQNGELRSILFVATGALMSPTASQQGESIPGIAHLVHLTSSAEG